MCPCLSRSQFMISCPAWLVSPSHGGDARASCVTPTPPASTSSLHGALLPAACSHTAPWLASSIFLSSHHLIPPPGCCSSPRAFGGGSQRLGLGTAPAVLFLGSCQGLAFSEGQEDNAPSILPVSEGLAVVFSPSTGWIGGCTSLLPLWEEEGRAACEEELLRATTNKAWNGSSQVLPRAFKF